jgi:hypothetical protein
VLEGLVEEDVAGEGLVLDDDLAAEEAAAPQAGLLQLDPPAEAQLDEDAPAEPGRDAVVPEGRVTLFNGK